MTKHEYLYKRFPLIRQVHFFNEPNISFSYLELDPSSPTRGTLGSSSVVMQFNTGSDVWRLQIRLYLLSFVKMLGVNTHRRDAGIEPRSKSDNSTEVLIGYVTVFDRRRIGGVEGGRLPMAPDPTFDDLMKQIKYYLDDVEAEKKQEESRASCPVHGHGGGR
ncbi:hypothetical protein LTR95_013502 [Oleoguttula sp. CCFEE 5521]